MTCKNEGKNQTNQTTHSARQLSRRDFLTLGATLTGTTFLAHA